MMSLNKLKLINRIFPYTPLKNNRILLNNVKSYASKSNRPNNTTQLILKGSAVGAVFGTLYAGYSYYRETQAVTDYKINEKVGPFVIEKKPDVKIMRKIVNPNDDSGLEITLFQFQTCPFCCKVRAFLDYSKFSYNVVEVDAVLRQSIKWSPSKKVPILLVKTSNGQYIQINDSSTIISTLASFLLDKSQDFYELASFYPSHTFVDDNGNKKSDIMNKYFLMYRKTSKNTNEVVE